MDEAEAEAALAGDGVGFGGADEHGGDKDEGGRGGRGKSRAKRPVGHYLALHSALRNPYHANSEYNENRVDTNMES